MRRSKLSKVAEDILVEVRYGRYWTKTSIQMLILGAREKLEEKLETKQFNLTRPVGSISLGIKFPYAETG